MQLMSQFTIQFVTFCSNLLRNNVPKLSKSLDLRSLYFLFLGADADVHFLQIIIFHSCSFPLKRK